MPSPPPLENPGRTASTVSTEGPRIAILPWGPIPDLSKGRPLFHTIAQLKCTTLHPQAKRRFDFQQSKVQRLIDDTDSSCVANCDPKQPDE